MIHSNCQGYISKQASIEKIVTSKSPDVFFGVATIMANYLRGYTVKVAIYGEQEKGDVEKGKKENILEG